ncbi:MAG: N-6 DNA methylase, partial [Chloroflexi bacterium]|nr:N-6 DNA methylase [Chloroflexota bacterium]
MLPPFDRHRFGSAASELGAEVRRVFARAMEVSHDYETIYAEDFGSTIPFLSDEAAAGWRDLIGQVELFDFTRMDYDVIGRIFERLIDPEERHRYGQHYTRPEIVDVVNAFCIHDPDAEVLDSSCGGGTFLVRAYARKRFLARRLGREPYHPELLSQLNGVDISQFAVHLSAVNLATRHLIDEANYPRIAHKDFFDVRRGTTLITLPVVSEGLGSGQRQDISLDLLDAVVGNPPYIRQEQLGRPYKDKLRTLLAEEYRTDPSPPRLSGRSDIHVYFWPHAAQFLKDGSFLGLLTSSTWMDVEYGFRLQEFLLRHFRIVAILESEVEPWFTEARVITAVTILQKEPSLANRDANMVRFVLLRKPIAEILGPATDEPTSQVNAENLAARILAVSANESNETWRVRLISQEALWAEGTRVPVDASDLETTASGSINETDEEDETDDDQPEMLDDEPEADQPLVPTEYIGSKWGIYLRAPDIYFTLLERSQATMVPLGTIATVKFGIKSGKDAFFFVRDITENERKLTKTEQAFRDKWSISYADTQRIRIVQSGDKSAHLVEARFLEPEFQRLTEAQNVVLRAVNVRKMTLAVNRTLSRLQGTRIAEYIRYGER